MRTGAEFDKDRNYRYALWRIWNEDKPVIMFIGLNPSTANELTNDPTIKRVIKLADHNGYGGFYMMNLFAIISSDPKYLLSCADPLGQNDHWLDNIAMECDAICFAWGVFRQAKERAALVKTKFPSAYCLRKTKDGHPWHPLFIPAKTKMITF